VSASVNTVILVGALARKPELVPLAARGTACSLRLVVKDVLEDATTGEPREREDFFDVDVFGARAEICHTRLREGSEVDIAGRLRWREWRAEDGQKRSAVSIIDDIPF